MKNITVKKYISSILIAVNVIYFSSKISYAAPQVSPLIIEQNRDQQREIDAEANQRLIQRPTLELPKTKAKIKMLLPKGECRMVSNVFTYGADLIPDSNRSLIIKPILNQCLNNLQITNIANQIQEWYLNAGFITTRVNIKQNQNSFIEKGNLEFWVIEGKIGQYIWDGNKNNKKYDNSRIYTAFPLKTGDILSIQALDQGLEQLNKLFSQKFKMQIKPSDRPGYSDIILIELNPSDISQKFTFNYSNGGVKTTGEDLYNLSYTKENLLGYNDTISLSWQKALPELENKNETIRLNASIPNGYWNFKFNYNYGNTIRKIDGVNVDFYSKSNIQTTQLTANWMMNRNKENKIESTFNVEYSERKSFINDTLIETSSRRISNINLGLIYTHYFPSSTLILSPTITNGLPLFGSIKNSNNIQKSQPHAEYNLIKLYGYYRQQYLASSRYLFSLQNSINAQYSDSTLYGEKQFVLGGEYSVRGFKENVVSSDNGISLRNDLILPIGVWMLPWIQNPNIAPLNFSLFYDIGETFPYTDGQRKTISGWGYSVSYNYKWFNASYATAKAINDSDIFDNDEGWVNYVNLSANYYF